MADDPEAPEKPKRKARKKRTGNGPGKGPAANGPSKKSQSRARAERAAKLKVPPKQILQGTIQPGAKKLITQAQRLAKRPERTWFIADMMVRAVYLTTVTPRFLAQVWGLQPSTVEAMATTAGTWLKTPEHAQRIDALRQRLTLTYLHYAAEAYAEGDRRESAEHLHMVAKLNGALETKHRVTIEDAFSQHMAAIEAKFGRERADEIFGVIAAAGRDLSLPESNPDPTVH